MFESLEPRRLFATAVVDGTLIIQGTAQADEISVIVKKGFYVVTFDGHVTRAVPKSQIQKIEIFGGMGGDKISVRHLSLGCLIVGGDGKDTIYGGSGNDTIIGGVGKDHLGGLGGDDTETGNYDNDVINGGAGDDFIWGGDGNDKIDGGSGNNLVYQPTSTETIKNATTTTTLPDDGVFIPDAVTPAPQIGFVEQNGHLIAQLRWTLPEGSTVIPGLMQKHNGSYYLDAITQTSTSGGPMENFDFAYTVDTLKGVFSHKTVNFRLDSPNFTGTNANGKSVGYLQLATFTKQTLPGALPDFSAVPVKQPDFNR